MPSADDYGTLAGVYEYLVPEDVLTPAGSVAAYAPMVDTFAPGARVLDCSAGIGLLAVGLALGGFEVVATDASAAMIQRARALAAEHGVDLEALACPWEELGRQGWDARFDVVFCTGNSIAHANGRAARRNALEQMASVLRPGGLLVIDSRNWERIRSLGSRVDVAERLRGDGPERALTIHAWTIPDTWDETLQLEAVIALIADNGSVRTRTDRLSFGPFTHHSLGEDLRASGFAPASSTYRDDVELYTVTATRAG